MHIHALCIRRYRSIQSASLRDCGGLNVLIGKNNSGKSNVLSALHLVQQHLSRGTIAGPMASARPIDEFTDRDISKPFQIGVEYSLTAEMNHQVRQMLKSNAPHLEKAIDQLRQHNRISIVVAGMHRSDGGFLFVRCIGAGNLIDKDDSLEIDGIYLLDITPQVAAQLYEFHLEATRLQEDVKAIDRLLQDSFRMDSLLSDERRMYFAPDLPAALSQDINRLSRKKPSRDDFISGLQALKSGAQSKINEVQQRDTEEPMAAFAGTAKAPPAYALALLKHFGGIKVLDLKETRAAVGREEAQALLTLKVTRGGLERLITVQNTVRGLLGVSVDAFQSEEPGQDRVAEIDVDRFLVEANGAGVREALRLVLDLELKQPALVLIEEPEVHLHPGLEHAVYQYLRDESQTIQVFVTTHSTSFVDSVSFQNIYLVSKGSDRRTTLTTLDTGDGALQIPAELGLRLSTVFMFDRLVFVEGPSDEAVLRELCKTLGLDLASRNVGFVQMGGVRNFAHFAAQSTLNLLTRRQVAMWFITDRDERDDEDVKRMLEMLNDKARLHVLERRELENYLMCPAAVLKLIELKASNGKSRGAPRPSQEDIEAAVVKEAQNLHPEVVRLLLHKKLLGTIHLIGRDNDSGIEDRLRKAIARLEQRLGTIDATRHDIEAELDTHWAKAAADKAPGTKVLENVMKKFGSSYSKEGGDSARLARLIPKAEIPLEIASLLNDIAAA